LPEISIRRRCLDLLADIVGAEGVPQFMRGTQLAFDGRTGAWMLNADPARLLRHLEALRDSLADDDLEDLPIIVDRPPARRSEREASKVLGILDELFPGGGDG